MGPGDGVKRVAMLVAASPTSAFLSQVAVLRRALDQLPWTVWRYSLHVYVGGPPEPGALERWRPHMTGVHFSWSSPEALARDGDWAQSDDVFRDAPKHVDAIVALDADTLPVRSLEPILDDVLEDGAVAGSIAHYPTILGQLDGDGTGPSVREAWRRLARDLVTAPLDFAFTHSLMGPDVSPLLREAPFYLNFGVVFFSRATFERIAPEYLRIRPVLAGRMRNGDFSGQAALTLAIAAVGAGTRALPLRYNFPNDPAAGRLHPAELDEIIVHHYLRTERYDRHRIFRSEADYRAFLAQPLEGVDRRFQADVRRTVGPVYPFA